MLSSKVARKLRKELKFDTIAFTGVSGAAVAFNVALQLKMPMLCVRKSNEHSHATSTIGYVEGNIHAKKYLIIDDTIATGSTIENIVNEINSQSPRAKCVGIMLYHFEHDMLGHEAGYTFKNATMKPVKIYSARAGNITPW